MNFARKISQLFFVFGSQPPWKPADGSLFERSAEPTPARRDEPVKELNTDEDLTQTCRELLIQLDLTGMAKVVQGFWNPRLRSTAGYALQRLVFQGQRFLICCFNVLSYSVHCFSESIASSDF